MKPLAGRSALAIGACLLVLAAPGCGNKLHSLLKPAPLPVASLRAVRLPTASADSAAFELTWSASAPGRRIDHYLIAIDPRSLDATDPAWQATRETRRVYGFAGRPAGSGPASAAAEAPARHVFALRVVDAAGEESPPVWRALALTNLPPTVQILSPHPSGLFYQVIPPSLHVFWTGDDPDGVTTQRPLMYKFKLFKDTDAIFGGVPIGTQQFDLARTNPDSLRRFYAPAFEGWENVAGETMDTQYSNLVPDSRYLFVLVGFDEAGDYNPVFSRDTNVLQLLVTFAGAVGPYIRMYNEYFDYTYASGGYSTDPSRVVNVQVPGSVPLKFNWSAVPLSGAEMRSYRWVIDLADLGDQTPRIDEVTDWNHWSQPSLQTTSATIGPFQPPGNGRENHLLYIEAQDNNGLVSLGIVRFMVVPRVFSDENSLLIVDDTRLLPDNAVFPFDPAHPDSLQPPPSGWPSAAELDTFLLARGGVRWRMTPNGTLSPPGIFAGYHFDTVSTRFTGFMALTLLNQYRHVVWITDQGSATGLNPSLGKGVLRTMSEAGHANTLAAYVKQGGQLWLAGGGAGTAATYAWNVTANDQQPPVGVLKFSSTPVQGRPPELSSGRFMYDLVHWQSGFYVSNGQIPVARSTGTAGGWPGAPNYALLPAQLRQKSAANDPTPPFRSLAQFLAAARFHSLEYLSEPNAILLDLDPDPGIENFASMVDTLFMAQGVPDPPSPPSPYIPACMTYYHGPDSGGLLFSGFDLWTFTRPDLITLADFVLQQVWGLSRDPVARSIESPRPVAGRPRGL
jgi:hypothetical protein